jgi:ketosteroid isomerase-like protein
MKRFATLAVLAALSSCQASATPAPPSAPAAPSPSSACAVWDREVAFARSVADHDAAAFAEHVHPGAIFLDAHGASQGRDAVVKAWDPLVRGEGLRLGWHPTSVLATGDPRVALSRGPYWLAIDKPGAPTKYMTGNFQSIWARDADGAWRVLVDGGTPPPQEVTREEVERVRASLPEKCPGG